MFQTNDRSRALKAAREFVFVLVLLVLGSLSREARAQAAAFRPGRILLVPKAAKAGDAAAMHKRKGHKVLKRYANFQNLEVVELQPGEDVAAAVKEYNASGAVEFAEPDYILKESATPNDPIFDNGSQYALNNTGQSGMFDADIDAPEGWDIRYDASNVIVAIVDSGMRMTHEDLAANLWTNTGEIPDNGIDDDGDGYVDDVHGINSITGTGDPTDDEGHGTHVAGIIGAAGNNGVGISGVAWNVQLMPLKFIGPDGSGATSDAVECVNYAWRHGAGVINASFGSPSFSSSLQTAIQSARTAGIVFVAAAGNESVNNDTTPSYPANYSLDNIVSVAALNSFDTLESYSNYGAATVDVGAPGGNIISCGNSADNSYVYMSGTSMASPLVAGVVALMKAQFPTNTPAQLIQRLIATVDPIPSLAGRCVSGGRVNLYRALSPYVTAGFTASVTAGTFPLGVQFSNTSVGEVASYVWDFGDGTTSTEASPSHVFTTEGSYNVTLTITGSNGATSSQSQTINVLPIYDFKSVAYEWIDPTSMTRLTLADNGVSGAQPLPFTFYFYGQAKSQIYIGANGLLGFSPANFATTSNGNIPSSSAPNDSIMPYWDNLNPAGGGAVYIGTVGTAPNRKFVASWVGVPRNTTPSDTMTFQAVLSETTGRVQFNYLEVRPTSTRGGGAHATIGVEAAGGLVATKYCFNGTPNRVANGQSLAFVASSSGGLVVTPAGVSNFIGDSVTLQTNSITFTLQNSGKGPLLWSASKKAPWLTLSATSGALASGAQVAVVASINNAVENLTPGSHNDTVSFVNLNNDNGDADRVVSVEVNATLSVRFKAPTFTNGVFQLQLPATAGQTFIIEASTDLASWIEVQQGIVGIDGIIPFSDSDARQGSRFFRAQLLP